VRISLLLWLLVGEYCLTSSEIVGSCTGREFYFVDMPGVGFARVPGAVSDRWTQFMREFFEKRPTLSVIFHLIDSKLGVMPHDRELMQMVAETEVTSKYVVVLTKIDKLPQGKVRSGVIEAVLGALQEMEIPLSTPVVPTSSEKRIGRDFLWRCLYSRVLR